MNFACTQNKYNNHLQIYRSIERSIRLSKARHTHNDYKLERRAIRHVALYLHTRPSHKCDTTSVSWYNTTTKRVKRNIQPPRATLTALPRQRGWGGGGPVRSMHNQNSIRKFRITNECPKLTAYSCTGPLLRRTQFLHTVTYGPSGLGSSVLCDVYALRWFECLSCSPSQNTLPYLCSTPNPLHPLMAANTQTKAVHYVARKCRRVPGSLPAGTTFEPALTARLITHRPPLPPGNTPGIHFC